MKQRKYLHVHIWNIGCTVLSLMLVAGDAYAAPRQFNWWGELGYDFLSNQFESVEDRIDHSGLLRLNAAGFLYEPWLATVEGGVGMFLRRTDQETGDSTSENFLGNGILRLFPQSRFPLELFAEKSDTRADTDLTGLTIDRTRYGINQSYVSRGGSSMSVGYERSDTTNISTDSASPAGERFREDVSDLFKARFNTAFGAHGLDFNASANYIDITNSIDRSETVFSTLRHSYTPSPVFSSEDMLTYNRNATITEFTSFETDLVQFNSFGFWRPQTKRPLRINGTIRVLARDSATSGVTNEAQTSTGTLGGTYEWSRHWVFNANAGITATETETAETTTHFQALNAIFTSRNYELWNLDASWFAQADFRNTDDDGERIQEYGGALGYNLDKSVAAENRHFYSLRWSQSVNSIADSEDFSSATLFSTASASWQRRGVRSNGMARVSVNDNRTYASGPNSDTLEGEFQLINLQASIDNQLSATSAVRANASLQISRNYRPEISGVIEGSNGDWIPTSTIDLTYFKLGLFRVPQLSFYSTFRHVSNSFAPLVGDPVGERVRRDDNQWENRLEYTVGRLQLRAISRLSDVQGEKQNYFLFQARRMFGQY